MKAKELLSELEKVSPEAEIILQKDAEGNGYSSLECIDGDAIYVADNTYSGNVFNAEWSADDAGMESDEWEKLKTEPRCVVLSPVN